MVAPAEHNEIESRGSFGEPLRRSFGVSFTNREMVALRRGSNFGSVSKLIRTLLDVPEFEKLITRTEAAARKSVDN